MWWGVRHNKLSSVTSYKGTNPIMEALPSCPHLNLITSQRLHLQIASCFWIQCQHILRDTIQSIARFTTFWSFPISTFQHSLKVIQSWNPGWNGFLCCLSMPHTPSWAPEAKSWCLGKRSWTVLCLAPFTVKEIIGSRINVGLSSCCLITLQCICLHAKPAFLKIILAMENFCSNET